MTGKIVYFKRGKTLKDLTPEDIEAFGFKLSDGKMYVPSDVKNLKTLLGLIDFYNIRFTEVG